MYRSITGVYSSGVSNIFQDESYLKKIKQVVSYFYSSFFCFLLCIYLAHFNIMICLPLTFVCYLGLWDPFSVFTKRKCMQLNYFNLFYLGVDLTSPRGVLTSSRGVRGHAPPGRLFLNVEVKCINLEHFEHSMN